MIAQAILPKIKPGATVKVFEKVKEGDKERVAQFSGLVLSRKHGSEQGASFMVRSTIAGVGVEKVFPINSPLIEKVEVIDAPKKVRRSKLYYVRELSRKETRQKMGTAK
ncbi:50S ribosomal protein L19 [Patescibacteria group bacterium]|nr:50S ribosomal protein L19 [Patescibacteria group bacterium]